MLLTLSANSLRSRILGTKAGGKGGGSAGAPLALTDLPRFARDVLGLHGLNVSTNLLAGSDMARLDALREAADKAGCPCLVLIESEPQRLADADEALGEASVERMSRVVQAAHRLGCNSIAVEIATTPVGKGAADAAEVFENAADRLRQVLAKAEKREINLLISPGAGFTEDPVRVTELIKKVGGFRIGTFPDFEAASKAADPTVYLKKIAPYASAMTASIRDPKPTKKGGAAAHDAYDLAAYVKVVLSVGYTGTLAIEYRAGDDAEASIRAAKAVLESAIGLEVSES